MNRLSRMDHTILVSGQHFLSVRQFYDFMNNLQSEVMELEFNEFARGKWRITELEFAEMLLRYTGAYDQARNLSFI